MNTKDITLICVDCLNYDAALRAIAKSTQNTEFHKTVFITDKHTLKAPDNVEIKIIDKIQSREAYSIRQPLAWASLSSSTVCVFMFWFPCL